VWGQGKYEPRGADVWALGVTLHAMAFGTLPFFSVDQQQLIEMVTSPAEWECAQQSEDASLLDLLHGVLTLTLTLTLTLILTLTLTLTLTAARPAARRAALLPRLPEITRDYPRLLDLLHGVLRYPSEE